MHIGASNSEDVEDLIRRGVESESHHSDFSTSHIDPGDTVAMGFERHAGQVLITFSARLLKDDPVAAS